MFTMLQLPTGTLTFLYTDVEGSTVRWEQHPGAMKDAVERHDAILQDAVEAAKGIVFRRMGDAFCACFVLAPQALDAVLAAQRALHLERWDPRIAPFKVRMALHTGPGEVRDGDYVGPHLNRIARLLAAGYGGQVLLTSATYPLVFDTLPDGVSVRDLGEHKLKDLQHPEHLYQLVVDGLPSDFRPIKTLGTRPNNLPVQPTDFIGREREVELAQEKLTRPQVRLVTFTGPGGTGKTRLSLQVGEKMLERFQDGVFFVPLSTLNDPALVPGTIAEALGVMKGGSRPIVESLKNYLGQKEMLLILDNFEQVLGAAGIVSEMLSGAPRLKTLVTSREVLHIYGEQEFPVPPLQLPDLHNLPPLVALARNESVHLFIERATSAKPSFELTSDYASAVAEICVRLDGLPLAIELAAARVKLLTPQAILSRLESRLKVLTGGARDLPARQQTLRATIDWSYDLLPPDERTLFCRMAVFMGGCTFEAAEAITTGQPLPANSASSSDPLAPLDIDIFDGVASLTDKSLLRQAESAHGESRLVMLETIREYALERLEERGETSAMKRAHAHYFLRVAEECAPLIQTPRQKETLQRLEIEHDNMRAALQWSLDGGGEKEVGLRIGTALHSFWQMRGHLSEGRRWMEGLLPSAPERTRLRARALHAAGYVAFLMGDRPAGQALLEESAAISRELGDKMGLAYANYLLGVTMAFGGDQEGRAVNSEAVELFRELGEQGKPGLVLGLMASGMLSFVRRDYSIARSTWEEYRALSREVGDPHGMAQSANYLGDVARVEGNYPLAGSFYEESLSLFQDQGGKSEAPAVLHNLGYVALAEGDYAKAVALFKESLMLHQEIGNKQGISECLTGFGALAGAQGDLARSARLFGASEALRSTIGAYMWPAEQIEWDRHLASARTKLDEVEWDRAWQEGAAMSMDAAVAYALAWSTQPDNILN
jgi:predicted ATPase/class 3 adenylate cyclase